MGKCQFLSMDLIWYVTPWLQFHIIEFEFTHAVFVKFLCILQVKWLHDKNALMIHNALSCFGSDLSKNGLISIFPHEVCSSGLLLMRNHDCIKFWLCVEQLWFVNSQFNSNTSELIRCHLDKHTIASLLTDELWRKWVNMPYGTNRNS